MDWTDLGLRAIRASGALASALAGVAALLTDGAFERRKIPLRGWLKNFPMAQYRITPWGGVLLTIILVAPTVQFVGDWVKDDQDAKTLQQTADAIKRDVDTTVGTSTARSQEAITSTVRADSQQQLATAQKLFDAQTAVGTKTNEIATSADGLPAMSGPAVILVQSAT